MSRHQPLGADALTNTVRLERTGKRIEDFDAAVAAHALATRAVLVTANVQHMVRILGPKTGRPSSRSPEDRSGRP